jgi:putative intracellular protease/amidase
MIRYIMDAGASVNADELVVRDGRIITGNSPDAITPFSREILEALLSK